MYERHLASLLVEALGDTPVVLLNGARQTGKSTLAQALSSGQNRRYLTLDDRVTLAAARGDPAGFIAGLEGPVVLDEVQRAPELFLAIKAAVDRDKGLRHLKETEPAAFQRGVVLYGGRELIPFATDLFAVPLTMWWAPLAR